MEDAQCNGKNVLFSYFDSLPDDIILCILKYITDFKDMYNLRYINKRLSVIAEDKTLARHIDCRGHYWLSTCILETFMRPIAKYVEVLNLDDCYWLRPTDVGIFLSCTRLRSLHIMQIDVPADILCQILSNQTQLTSLSISISDIDDFHVKLAASPGAQETLRHVVKLKLHFSTKFYHGYRPVVNYSMAPTLFEYCRDIQEIHMLGSLKCSRAVTRSIIQPQECDVNNLRNIRVMTLNSSMDPAVRLLFFETLHLACTAPVHFTTLLMSDCREDQRWNTAPYVHAMQGNDFLVHYEASGAHAIFVNILHNFKSAYHMRYLNVSGNRRVGQLKLRGLSEVCPNLESLNLENCVNLLLENIPPEYNVQFDGQRIYAATHLVNLILRCVKLRNLNLNGVHIHPEYMVHSFYKNLASLLSTNRKWQSLSLPSCCLHTEHTSCCTPGETEQNNPTNTIRRKRRRLSKFNVPDLMPLSLLPQPETDFQRLIRLTPDMKHFELICPDFTSAFSKSYGVLPTGSTNEPCKASLNVTDCDLKNISKWSHLKSLQLSGIAGIQLGHCLWTIAKGCTSLQQLYLSCLGNLTHCTYRNWLVESLPLFSKLKDLRLEQPHLVVDKKLLSAIGKCSSLERICIITLRGTFSTEGVQRLFVSLPGLISFQLYTDEPVRKCVQLQNFLREEYQKSRPALSVCIYPLLNPNLQQVIARDVPDQHFDEMTILKSRVASRPTAI